MRRIPWIVVIGLFVMAFHHGGYWAATWLSKWAYLFAAFSVVFGVWFGRRTTATAGLLCTYLLLSAWASGIWPTSVYRGSLDLVSLLALEQNALYAYVVVLVTALCTVIIPSDVLRNAYIFLALVPVISVYSTLSHEPGWGSPIYGNASMSGCMIAATLPFLLRMRSLAWPGAKVLSLTLIAAATWAVFWTKASIPVGVLAVSVGSYYLALSRVTRSTIGTLLAFTILLAVIGQHTYGAEFLDNNGRFDIWRTCYHWWKAHSNPWFGTGLGTVQILVPLIQNELRPGDMSFFMWLHNDWYQLLFETGWVGVACLIPMWLWLLLESWRTPALFAGLAGFSAMACFNYPLRMPVHAFCLFLICALILRDQKRHPAAVQDHDDA